MICSEKALGPFAATCIGAVPYASVLSRDLSRLSREAGYLCSIRAALSLARGTSACPRSGSSENRLDDLFGKSARTFCRYLHRGRPVRISFVPRFVPSVPRSWIPVFHPSIEARREARRAAGPAIHEHRIGHQSQDREIARPFLSDYTVGSCRRGDRVRRRNFITLLGGVGASQCSEQRGAGGLDLRAPFPFPWYPPRGNSYGLPLSSAPCSMPLSPSIWNGFFRVGRSR
jgi:hypothetical protein